MAHTNKKDDKIMRTPTEDLPQDVKGVAEQLYDAMVYHKDKIAQIDAESGESETFSSLLKRSIKVAVNLRRMGITPEDILTPCTDNHMDTAVMLIGIIFTGANVAPIDSIAPDEDRTKQLSLIKPRMMFCSINALERAERMVKMLKLETRIIVFGKREGFMSFDELLVSEMGDEEAFTPYVPRNLFETVMILFTSGTTGVPHGICLHNYGVILTALAGGFNPRNDRNESARDLVFSSLVWFTGVLNICRNTIEGRTRIVCSFFTPAKTWKYLDKHKISRLVLSGGHVLALINNERPSGLDLTYLKEIVAMGSPLSAEAVRRIKSTFPGVCLTVAYGLTELCRGITRIKFDDTNGLINTKAASIGSLQPGIEAKIVDPDTEEVLGPNQVGEFRAKALSMMIGYYNEDSTSCYDSDGFFKSGDLLYYDEDGYFYFVERLKEVLRYNMVAINPTELEGILHEYPGVELAVVVGVPSDAGDLPVGIVVRNDDTIKPKDLNDFLAKRVDETKLLHGGIRFVDKSYIPFTPSGKVQRRTLRALLVQDMSVECKI